MDLNSDLQIIKNGVFSLTATNDNQFTDKLIKFKNKLSCKDNNDYIEMICVQAISPKLFIKLSELDENYFNSAVIDSIGKRNEITNIIKSMLLLTVDGDGDSNNQSINYWNLLKLLKQFETKEIDDFFESFKSQVKIYQNKLFEIFKFKNKNNMCFKFINCIRDGGMGKYFTYWNKIPIENLFLLQLNEDITIDKLQNYQSEIDYYSNDNERGKCELLYKQFIDKVKFPIDSLILQNPQKPQKPLKVPQKGYNVGEQLKIDLTSFRIIKNSKLNDALVNSFSEFRKRQETFEFCNRDISLLEELVYCFYKTKFETRNYSFKQGVKKFTNNCFQIKDKDFICGSIGSSNPTNTNASLKSIKIERKGKKDRKKRNFDFTQGFFKNSNGGVKRTSLDNPYAQTTAFIISNALFNVN